MVGEIKVSVVMPTYNGSKFIKRAVESILAQTYTNFEFIIVDDGSTDITAQIIHSYKDKRIKYIHQENKGPPQLTTLDLKIGNRFYFHYGS